MQLSTFKTGWKKLDDILNNIVGAINANCPQRSDSILIDETASGAIIKIAPPTDTSIAPSTSSSSGSTTDDDSSEDSAISDLQIQMTLVQAQLAAISATLQGVVVQQITVVNPGANCAQSTVAFLVKPSS